MQVVKPRVSPKKHMSWSSAAFIVESVLLLLFLVASLAVLAQTFTAALNRSVESRTLDAATIAASSISEHFAADPTGVQPETQLGDLRVVCGVTEEARSGGTMYHAQIDVFDAGSEDSGQPVYSITTSRYESGAV